MSTYLPYDVPQIEDVQMTFAMSSGVIQDFQRQDMRVLLGDNFNFRVAQRFPIKFIVSTYPARLDNSGGLLGAFSWRGG